MALVLLLLNHGVWVTTILLSMVMATFGFYRMAIEIISGLLVLLILLLHPISAYSLRRQQDVNRQELLLPPITGTCFFPSSILSHQIQQPKKMQQVMMLFSIHIQPLLLQGVSF